MIICFASEGMVAKIMQFTILICITITITHADIDTNTSPRIIELSSLSTEILDRIFYHFCLPGLLPNSLFTQEQ